MRDTREVPTKRWLMLPEGATLAGMDPTDWQLLHEKSAYRGWRGVVQRTYRLPDGSEATYDVVTNGSYVTVAAFTKAREAILVHQFRPGPGRVLTSFCEGYIDAAETGEEAARRELLEETGYAAEKWRLLRPHYSAYSTEYRESWVAVDCAWVQAPQLDDTEFIRIELLPLAQFRAYLRGPQPFANVDTAYQALDVLGWL